MKCVHKVDCIVVDCIVVGSRMNLFGTLSQ